MTVAPNSIEGKAKTIADRIEQVQLQIEHEQERCREICEPLRDDLSELWTEAKSGGLPMKAMRAYVKVRTAQRKAVAKLVPDEKAAYENLREALGPLGEAAAQRAGVV